MILRFLVSKTTEELEMEAKMLDHNTKRKNAEHYSSSFYRLAQDAYRKRKYDVSLQYSHRGAEVASSMDSINLKKLRATCLEIQGDSEIALGRDTNAIELFKQVVVLRSDAYGHVHHMSVARAIDTLSRIYRRHAAYTLALHYGTYLYEICHHNSLSVSKQMASAMSNMAKIRRAQGLLNEAFLLEVEAFQMRVSVCGRNSCCSARSLHSIGMIRQELGDHGQSTEDMYMKALEIFQHLAGESPTSPSTPSQPNSPNNRPVPYSNERADVYASLSSLSRLQKNVEKYIRFKSLEITMREAAGLLCTALGKALWDLGAAYELQENSDDGSACRLSAIKVFTRVHGEGSTKALHYVRSHESTIQKHKEKKLSNASHS